MLFGSCFAVIVIAQTASQPALFHHSCARLTVAFLQVQLAVVLLDVLTNICGHGRGCGRAWATKTASQPALLHDIFNPITITFVLVQLTVVLLDVLANI